MFEKSMLTHSLKMFEKSMLTHSLAWGFGQVYDHSVWWREIHLEDIRFISFLFLDSARRGRIYLPKDELAQFGIGEEDIFAGKVTDKWRAFMKNQIERARMFFNEAEKGVIELDKDSRWPVCHVFINHIIYVKTSLGFSVWSFGVYV